MTFDARMIPTDAAVTMTPAAHGWPLRTYRQPARGAARGNILWLGGRGDIFEKYLETFDHWASRGWSVTSFDWRGQGGSGRLGPDANVGHVDRFAPWIDDLTHFFDAWRAREAGTRIVMGHSMGGHLLLRALAEARVAPDKAVLVAPMLSFDTGPLPFRLAAFFARGMARLSARRRAWKHNERPGPPGASRQAYLTRDDVRYSDELWWKERDPSLALGPPSWSWLAAAYRSIARLQRPGAVERVTTPILIVGSDGDKLVSPAAMRAFAARLPNAKLEMFDAEVAHEILRETDAARDAALAAIDRFIA
ncbi:MAG: alpha/beta hydrolase [Sphingomonadaceae bacterium]|nr:alpha/beta hydrolase [Sphingomonadaceae bacterium]